MKPSKVMLYWLEEYLELKFLPRRARISREAEGGRV